MYHQKHRKKLNHVLSIYLMLSNGDKRNILFVLCLSVFGFSPNSRQCQSLIHYKWKAAYFDTCSLLIVIEICRFFSVPHLLWHVASVYNCNFRWPVTFTPIAEVLSVDLSLSVFKRLKCVPTRIRTPNLFLLLVLPE